MMRRTKIVCTLGPTSNDIEVIKNLIRAGLDAARINFSHGTYETHEDIIKKLIKAREDLQRPIPLVLDTKGPEIRIKTFKEDKIYIEQGSTFTLTTKDIVGDKTTVAITYEDLPNDVEVGGRILIDDGLIELKITKITKTDIICKAVNSGFLSSRKGVNVPDVYVNLPSLTEKDKEDIKFGIRTGFDFIAASFVRSAKDVLAIREVLEENGGMHLQIIAKIESRDGVNNIDSILEVADGIMVARGDLGVEIPPEEVPLVQKMLIKKANIKGKPVITATQMLESMVNNPRPTRAEANDVANAIFDGSDAIMLSGETALGKYPVESVQMMARIAAKTEESINYEKNIISHHIHNALSITNAISYATCTTAADLKASCIVTVTNSGFTARMVSKFKPTCPVIAVVPEALIYRQLNLVWGCFPCLSNINISKDKSVSEEGIFSISAKKAVEMGYAKNGDPIIIVAGVPVGIAGSTNLLKVQIVGDVLVRGDAVGKGVVVGRTSVIKVAEEGEKYFSNGDILVTSETNDKMMPFIRKAKAVIVGSDQKIDTSHAEIACKALQIPIIVCDDRVVDLIPNGVVVSVDTENGFVYNGIIDSNK